MTTLIETIQMLAKNYRRGVICPAEFWSVLARHVEEHPTAALDALPADVQQEVRLVIAESPDSVYPSHVPRHVRQAIAAWCQAEE